MKHLSRAVAHGGDRGQHYGNDRLRAELEQQRRFRVEQLAELTSDKTTAVDGPLDEVTSALIVAASAALGDIDGALSRIQSGCYGLCSRCGQVIAPERLEALPMAGLCMECQQAKEATVEPQVRLRELSVSPGQDSTDEARAGEPSAPDIVEVWGFGSFPASDPPANW